MSTFGQFTCMPPPALGAWESRYYEHARRSGRLGGFGSTPGPTSEQIACWVEEDKKMARDVRGHLDTLDTNFSRPDYQWLGSVICPKPDPWGRHPLYDIFIQEAASAGDPPEYLYLMPAGQQYQRRVTIAGLGYFDGMPGGDLTDDGRAGSPWDHSYTIFAADKKHLIRCHTPMGVAHKGIGAGAALYAALAMGAINQNWEGVYSIEGTRSNEAAALWMAARNPKTGPLASRFGAAIELGNPDAYVDIGYRSQCLEENLVVTPVTTINGCRVSHVGCSTSDETRRRGTVNVDYIVDAGIKRWGLVVFNAKKGAGMVRPKWTSADSTKAFGARAKPADVAARMTLLSDRGAEILSRAAVGASPHLVARIAQGLSTRSPDLAHAFLTREDIIAILSATPAGRKLLTSTGAGGELSGISGATLRDATAAMYRPTSPTALTLPRVSRATQAFIDSYPEV